MNSINPRSNWWFLLPIFMAIIGGVIAYFALRHDDPKKAKNCLYLGIILTVVGIVSNALLWALVGEYAAGHALEAKM